METMIVADELLNDVNYENSLFSEVALDNIVFYNFTKKKFGYGDDTRGWMNTKDSYSKIIDMEVLGKGQVRIWYDKKLKNRMI